MLTRQWIIAVKTCILGSLTCTNAYAQPQVNESALSASYSSVEAIYRNYAEKNHAPGMVIGIVANGKLATSFVSGMANQQNSTPVSKTSVFRIASMSKSFAAVAILQLRDQGKLQLDDAAERYLPEIQSSPYLTTDAPKITIRHLLTHAAGFPEDNPWGDRQLDISTNEMLNMFKNGISYSTVPGTTYEYSNMGFAMLGAIIERVSGITYQEYIRENIWKPLGMNATYWEYSQVPAARLAIGYRWVNNEWLAQPMEHDGAYGIMGGILTTMEDYAKYVAFMLQAWPARSDSDDQLPIKRSSLREMQHPWNFNSLNAAAKTAAGTACPMVNAYGYGLRWTKDCNGITTVGHSGGLPGFGSNWMIVPQLGIGIISFINQTYAPATTLNFQALETMIKTGKLQPSAALASPILAQRQKELLSFLPHWKNAEKSPVFAENFFLDFFVDSLRKQSTQMFKQIGTITGHDPVIPENNLRGSFLLKGEKGAIRIYYTLSPELPAKIQYLDMRLIEL